MRAIDGDALKESLKESRDKCRGWASDCEANADPEMLENAKQAVLTFNECIMRVNEMPTIEPERKGKWKGYNADDPNWLRTDGSPVFIICSECGQVVLNNISAHWNYCSNCGCKMEVEE